MKIIHNTKQLFVLFICLTNVSASISFFSTEGDNMSMIKWRPFGDLEELFEFRPLQGKAFDTGKMDMYEEDGNIVVKMNVPGIDADEIDIRVHDNHLHVSAKHEQKKEEKDKDYYYKEMSSGSFQRMVTLPSFVDESEIVAEVSDGVLTITLPKTAEEENQVKKIKVTRK